MATITDLNSSDNGAVSMETINNNFDNINADKIDGLSASVDSEVVLFSGTGGKTIKRASISGIAKLSSGILSAAVADIDYASVSSVNNHIAATTAHLWTDGSGSITPNNVTGGITCELTDNGWWNMDRTVAGASGDQYGLGAGVIRASSGSNNLVAAALHAHALGTFVGSAWGLALEAWTGNHSTEGTASANLIGCESSCYAQYHANIGQTLAFHAVFKNRPDGQANVTHGTSGTNKFNINSEVFRIESQARSSSGEYCGWNTGIRFIANALDRSSTEAYTRLIDFRLCTIDNNGSNPWMFTWQDPSLGDQMGMRYNTSNHYLEFYRGLDTTPTLAGYIDMLGASHAL